MYFCSGIGSFKIACTACTHRRRTPATGGRRRTPRVMSRANSRTGERGNTVSEQSDQGRQMPAAGYYDHPQVPGWVAYWDGRAWDLTRASAKAGGALPPPPGWEHERREAAVRFLAGVGIILFGEAAWTIWNVGAQRAQLTGWAIGLAVGGGWAIWSSWRHYQQSRRLGGPAFGTSGVVLVLGSAIAIAISTSAASNVYGEPPTLAVGACTDMQGAIIPCADRDAAYRITGFATATSGCPGPSRAYRNESGDHVVACVEHYVGMN